MAETAPPEKLHLGDRALERWVTQLMGAPSKLHALRDECEKLAQILHGVLRSVSDLEVQAGDIDSEAMSTAYEQQMIDEQIAELPPEQARLRKAAASMNKALEQLKADFESDNDSKAFFEQAIAKLEVEVGLGAGWTQGQLQKKRALQRQIEEVAVDKERRQQELDQVRRENAAGREATERSAAALTRTEEELAATRASTAKFEAEAAAHTEAKRLKQEEMKVMYAEHGRLAELDPVTQRAVEDGVKEINEVHRQTHEVQRRTDILMKQMDASAHAKEAKQRDIDEARLHSKHRREEMEEIKAATAVVRSETAEVLKQAGQVKRLAAKAEAKTAEAEADRVKAEADKAEVKAKIAAVEADVAAAKRQHQQLAREADALRAQKALLAGQEREKLDAVVGVKKMLEIMHVQQRALVLEVCFCERRFARAATHRFSFFFFCT